MYFMLFLCFSVSLLRQKIKQKAWNRNSVPHEYRAPATFEDFKREFSAVLLPVHGKYVMHNILYDLAKFMRFAFAAVMFVGIY